MITAEFYLKIFTVILKATYEEKASNLKTKKPTSTAIAVDAGHTFN